MKRTNIIIKLCLALGIMSFSSCSDDFLNVPSNDVIQVSASYQTQKQAEQALYGIYSDLRPFSADEYLFMSEVRSDNAWVNPKPNALREYSEIGTFRAGSDIVTFNSVWNEWYRVILDANSLIDKIPSITFTSQAIQDQYTGEAYFLRGWAYFELTRLFGNIPIIDKPMIADEVNKIKQSPAVEVYKKIILPDLSKAESLLPLTKDLKTAEGASASGFGRADKIAAKAMLGRVYMTMSGFPVLDPVAQDSAAVKLKYVIDFSAANVNKFWATDSTEWKKQWISENNNKYSIFAIQYRSGGTGNPAIFNFGHGLPPTYTSMTIYGNEIYIDKALMFNLAQVNAVTGKPDSRVYNTTILTGYPAVVGNAIWPAYANPISPRDGVTGPLVLSQTMFYKYVNSFPKRTYLGYTANIETAMKDYSDWPVNYPVIRLEDVQLMYAEYLLNKSGDINGAVAIVNKIRTRAGASAVSPATVPDAILAVKNERRIEFCGEGVRWFDIVRWGEWKKDIEDKFDRNPNSGVDKANIKNGRYLYPIPSPQMLVQPGLYVQNPDY